MAASNCKMQQFLDFCQWWPTVGDGKKLSQPGAGVDPDYADKETEYHPEVTLVFNPPASKSGDYFVGMIWYGWDQPPLPKGSPENDSISLPHAWFQINREGDIAEEDTTVPIRGGGGWVGGYTELYRTIFDLESGVPEFTDLRIVPTSKEWEKEIVVRKYGGNWECFYNGFDFRDEDSVEEESRSSPLFLLQEVPEWLKAPKTKSNFCSKKPAKKKAKRARPNESDASSVLSEDDYAPENGRLTEVLEGLEDGVKSGSIPLFALESFLNAWKKP